MRASKKKSCINRVCNYCHNSFYIGKDNIDDAIYYGRKTYHSKCFLNMKARSQFSCPSQFVPKKKIPQYDMLINKYHLDISKYKNGNRFVDHGKEQLLKDYNEILKQEYDDKKNKMIAFIKEYSNSEEFQDIKTKSYKHLSYSVEMQCVYEFIRDNYDISIIPTTVWEKLKGIYNGSFKDIGTRIPPSDLLDMWKRKIDMLNGITKQLELNGKHLAPEDKLAYDLSVLVNKYDSYLRWKEKQKILEAEKENTTTQNIVGQSIGYSNVQQNNQNNTDDITDLVDDIFG